MAKWRYTLKFRTSVSVFSGLAAAGLVDRMVMRNHEGLPIIPGSSVKGRWRFFAERLLRGNDFPGGLTFHKQKEPLCKNPGNACTICRLFGNSSIPSLLWIGQAEPLGEIKSLLKELLELNPNPVIHPDAELRPGIALSRVFRNALENHLFFDEAVPALTFCGMVLSRGDMQPGEEEFLKVAGSLVDRVGARKAVGRGILDGGIRIEGGEA